MAVNIEKYKGLTPIAVEDAYLAHAQRKNAKTGAMEDIDVPTFVITAKRANGEKDSVEIDAIATVKMAAAGAPWMKLMSDYFAKFNGKDKWMQAQRAKALEKQIDPKAEERPMEVEKPQVSDTETKPKKGKSKDDVEEPPAKKSKAVEEPKKRKSKDVDVSEEEPKPKKGKAKPEPEPEPKKKKSNKKAEPEHKPEPTPEPEPKKSKTKAKTTEPEAKKPEPIVIDESEPEPEQKVSTAGSDEEAEPELPDLEIGSPIDKIKEKKGKDLTNALFALYEKINVYSAKIAPESPVEYSKSEWFKAEGLVMDLSAKSEMALAGACGLMRAVAEDVVSEGAVVTFTPDQDDQAVWKFTLAHYSDSDKPALRSTELRSTMWLQLKKPKLVTNEDDDKKQQIRLLADDCFELADNYVRWVLGGKGTLKEYVAVLQKACVSGTFLSLWDLLNWNDAKLRASHKKRSEAVKDREHRRHLAEESRKLEELKRKREAEAKADAEAADAKAKADAEAKAKPKKVLTIPTVPESPPASPVQYPSYVMDTIEDPMWADLRAAVQKDTSLARMACAQIASAINAVIPQAEITVEDTLDAGKLRDKLIGLRTENDKLNTINDEISSYTVKAAKAHEAEVKSLKRKLEDQEAEYSDKIAKLEADLKQAGDDIYEQADLRSQLDALTLQQEELQTKYEDLLKQKGSSSVAYEQRISDLQRELETANAQVSDYAAETNRANMERDSLKAQVDLLVAQRPNVANLEKQIELLNQLTTIINNTSSGISDVSATIYSEIKKL